MADIPDDPSPDPGMTYHQVTIDECSPSRLVALYPAVQAHGVPTPAEMALVYFNQRPRSFGIENLLGMVSSLTYDLAAWCEANLPHSPELALAIGAGGKLDEFQRLCKAAIVRRHPDQTRDVDRFPNRYGAPDLSAPAEQSNTNQGDTA